MESQTTTKVPNEYTGNKSVQEKDSFTFSSFVKVLQSQILKIY